MIPIDATMKLREETNVYRCDDGSTVTVHRKYPPQDFEFGVLRHCGDPGGKFVNEIPRKRAKRRPATRRKSKR